MAIPHSLTRAARNAVQTSPILQDPAALRAPNRPQLRRYEVLSLLPNGDIAETRHIAPALPLFENAFSAFTRGALIETDRGPVAIEDLLPGDHVLTHEGKSEMVLWRGQTRLVPGQPGKNNRNHKLTRFMSDSFGMQVPMSCVLAGPSARILRTPAHLRHLSDGEPMLTPVQEFQDGLNIVETAPPTPVELFHIALSRHAVIRVGGLEFETYHPGENTLRTTSHAMRALFLNLFPHIDEITDFGKLCALRTGDGPVDAIVA